MRQKWTQCFCVYTLLFAWLIFGQQTQAAAAITMQSTAPASTIPPSATSIGPIPFEGAQLELGSPLAPLTVIEYLSVTCSHCAAFERDTWPEVDRDLVRTGAVRFIVREMPTAPVAVSAAGFLLARCAGEDRYWPSVQALLTRQDEVLQTADPQQAITVEARIVGLNTSQARTCLSNAEAVDAIDARREAGLKAGVDSTPFFIINDRPLLAGVKLAGSTYQGGELSLREFEAALRPALDPKAGGFSRQRGHHRDARR